MKYIKTTIKYFAFFITLFVFTAFVFGETTENKEKELLKLYPYFASSMDSPLFVVEFINTSPQTLQTQDLIEYYENESIILDGQEYTRYVIKLGELPVLEPDSKWQHTISVDEFILGSEKQKYSRNLKRWRWKSPLKSGRHTLIFKFAGKKSNLIEFIWDDSDPFLYE